MKQFTLPYTILLIHDQVCFSCIMILALVKVMDRETGDGLIDNQFEYVVRTRYPKAILKLTITGSR